MTHFNRLSESYSLGSNNRLRSASIALMFTLMLAASACGRDTTKVNTDDPSAATTPATGAVYVVHDTSVTTAFEAAGIAQAMQQATLSTKLMGTVTAVLVRAGDHVANGQVLARIDARDLGARSAQVAASIADAEAMQREARAQAARFRALFADSAATRVQLDAAETGLARADAAVNAARAASGEVDAMSSYAVVRAPFAGTITARSVDAGAFASPGAPLLTIQDASTLRIVATASADAIRGLARGRAIAATIDGVPVRAVIEGIVPGIGSNLFTINATVVNRDGTYRAGSAAALQLPLGAHRAIVIPQRALVYEGDLTGVLVRAKGRDERRWVRLGAVVADGIAGSVEIVSGLSAGEAIVVPSIAAPKSTPTPTPNGAR